MDYLPLFFDLRGRTCLLVGGGSIALRKARLLIRAHAKVTLVAPHTDPELQTLLEQSQGSVFTEPYTDAHLEGAVLVISATNIDTVNEQVAKDCKARNIPVNVVDSPELCTVIMPAIVDRSPLLIGISSGGEAPVLARMVRTQLESTIPAAYGSLAKLAQKFRSAVKARFDDIDLRRRFWEATLSGPVQEHVLAGDMAQAETLFKTALEEDDGRMVGEVYLVGAGPGDPDLLTFKALRLMQRAEVVLYDRLVSKPILDMVRKDAELIYVGKKRSDHAVQQTDINQLLLRLAQEGKRVLRLKGGDPFIFGRGAEEIELLAQNNISFQVVPGITAASGCASYAGIPLTHRDYAQSVRFVTGHLKNDTCDLAWPELVSKNQTLVFYMGLMGVPTICKELMAHGKDESTPVALIEQGTTPEQKVHVSCLRDLPEYIQNHKVKPPTLLVIGGVVELHKTLAWFKPEQ